MPVLSRHNLCVLIGWSAVLIVVLYFWFVVLSVDADTMIAYAAVTALCIVVGIDLVREWLL